MKIFNKTSVSIAAMLSIFLIFGFAGIITASAATTPSLGDAAGYGVLGDTYTNPIGPTTINGSVGFTTGPAVTPLGAHTNYGSGAPYSTAGSGAATALADLNSQACTFTFVAPAVVLDTTIEHSPTYGPGVYCSTGAMSIGTAGGITLSGSGTYIFRSGGALNAVTGSTVNLGPGASACDVFWTPNGATTLNANSTFVGTVIPVAQDITVLSGTSWIGRALAFLNTITTPDADVSITVPTCTPPPAAFHVIKVVNNTGGGTAIASGFNVHVKSAGVDVAGSPAAGTGAPGTSYTLTAGTYSVSEDANASYTTSFGGDCDAGGNITLASGGDKTCTVINTYIIPPVPPTPPAGGGSSGYHLIPVIGLLKVPTPLNLPLGSGPVTYNYTVWNVQGFQSLVDITLTDDKCSPVTFVSGDINNDKRLDQGEKWKYVCSSNLSQTTTNTAIATGYGSDIYHTPAVATAVATVSVGGQLPPPLINIVKVPSRLTPFPFGGGDVTYTYTVTNPGVVAMRDVTVTDDKCSSVGRVSGDANNDNLLDTSESWVYACRMNISASTRNVATAMGKANGFTAVSYAFANVIVSEGQVFGASTGFPNTGFPPVNNGADWNIATLIALVVLVSVVIAGILRKNKI